MSSPTTGMIQIQLPNLNIDAIGTINADGLNDLLAANGDYFAGLSSGGFNTTPGMFSFGFTPAVTAFADVTKDGKPDLIGASNSGQVAVLANQGGGSYSLSSSVALLNGATQVVGMVTGDLNNDGTTDIMVATQSAYTDTNNNITITSSSVTPLLSESGTLVIGAAVAVASPINQIALADINGDGKLDLVVATATGIEVFDGMGGGSFGAATTYLSGVVVDSIALGDLNGDGKPDIVAGVLANYAGAAMVDVLMNNGLGVFGTPTGYLPVSSTPSASDYGSGLAVAITDLNGDGKPDVAVTTVQTNDNSLTQMQNSLTVLTNNGAGTLIAGTPVSLVASGDVVSDTVTSASLVVGDLNNDGRPDLISNETLANAGQVTVGLISATQYSSAAAALAAVGGTSGPFAISDSAANVIANLGSLEPYAASGRLVSVTLTDGGTPTLALTAAQFIADAGVLAAIQGSWSSSVTGVSAANLVADEANAHVGSLTLADTAAAISALLASTPAALSNSELGAITVTDGKTITLAAANYLSDLTILGKLRGTSAVALTGGSLGTVQNQGSLALALPYGGTDAVSVAMLADQSFPFGLSTVALSGGAAAYSPGIITAANAGSDAISWSETDTTLASTISLSGTVTLTDGPGPSFTAATGAPEVKSKGTVALGAASAGFGNHLLRATLLSDPGDAGATMAVDASGNVDYIAGTVTSGNSGFDTIKFRLTDLTTGTTTDQTATVSLATSPGVPFDLNGDGNADIVLQNSGQTGVWFMNGASLTGSALLPFTGANWHVVGSGDFNSDGNSDLLWRADDGTVALWQMQGSTLAGSMVLGNPGTAWMPVAIADTNGDGNSDIIWQNASGQVAVWDMQGAAIIASAVVANPGTFWHVRGAETLPGGGADLLLQGDDGSVALWDVNGTSLVGSTVLANPGTAWRAIGLANLTGTGQPDVIYQNQDGTVAAWVINNGSIASSAIIADAPPQWHVTGLADLNGDGKTDMILQDDAGDVAAWIMNGTTIASSAIVATPGPAWSVMGNGPMQFINANAAGSYTAPGIEDEFIVNAPGGAITIAGFNPSWDLIALNGAKFASFSAVQSATTTSSGSAVINLGSGSTLTLSGVTAAQLSAKNFILQ